MNKKNDETIFRIFLISGFVLMFLSILILFEPIQNYFIHWVARRLNRSLTKEIWFERFSLWGKESIISFILFEIGLFVYKIQDQRKIKLDTNFFTTLIFTLGSVFLVFSACISKDLNLDEYFSMALVQHPFSEVAKFTALDVHPPLYYFILKIFSDVFNYSIIVGKIVSAIPCVLLLFVAIKFLSLEFSHFSAIVFEILFLSSTIIFKYTAEIRMYSWGFLFILLCAICSFYMIKTGRLKSYLLYIFFAECAAYSHYFAAVAVLINFIFVSAILIWKDKSSAKKLLLIAIIGILCYLPWLKEVVSQVNTVSQDYWIGPIKKRDIFYFFITLFSLNFTESDEFVFSLVNLSAMIFSFVSFFRLILKIRTSENKEKIFFELNLFLTIMFFILAGIILSVTIRPIFINRYIVLTIPLLIFYVSICADKFLAEKIRNCIIITILSGIFVCSIDSFIYRLEHRKAFNTFDERILKVLNKDVHFIYSETMKSDFYQMMTYHFPNNNHLEGFFDEIFSKQFNKDFDSRNICYVFTPSDNIPDSLKTLNYTEAAPNKFPLKFYFPDEARIK